MYGFLVLLPLTLITAAIGGVLVFSPQVRDYVDFIATIGGNPDKTRLGIQIAAHVLAYALTCFVLVATTRTIAAPVSRERNDLLCRVQMALQAIFVAVPSLIILALATYAMVRRVNAATTGTQLAGAADLGGPPEALFWKAASIAGAALAAIVLSGRPQEPRRFALSLITIVAGIPTVLWLALLGQAAVSGAPSMILTLTAAVGAVGLGASVSAVLLTRRPLELFQSTLIPLSITLTDVMAVLALAATAAFGASLVLSPVEAATFLGMFPALFLMSCVALLVVAAVFARGSSPVAIISIAVSAVVIMHSVDFLTPTREFRYRSEIPPALQAKLNGKDALEIREIEKERRIMDLRAAFLEWLQVRREAIAAYRKIGRTYPVMVVAAQGGGVYAAYHSALSLARLYDACPEVIDHIFILSGVSGGALGSAVFTELVRSIPENLRTRPGEPVLTCNPRAGAPKLEDKVKDFFGGDFLSPVVDSAMLFDIPSLLVPWLRFGLDRAYALEYAFEDAWGKMARHRGSNGKGPPPPYGLEADFYGRWKPDGPVPALFLGATGVNSGVPVVVSQIKWSQGLGGSWRLEREGASDLLRMAQAQSERTRSSISVNLLDFRPDLQIATSTAVALSARFPYITPPANIKRNDKIKAPDGFFSKIQVLEMLDGAYFDNSGGWVAIDILDDLERYLRPRRWNSALYDGFKEFYDDIRFHLIRFTDRAEQRRGAASEDEHFELLTPLVAFNAVRSARGAQLRGVRDLDRTSESFFYLSDPWFTPSLNWLLGPNTKANIELRSWGEAKPENEVCCLLRAPILPAVPGTTKRPVSSGLPRDVKWELAEKLNEQWQKDASPSQPALELTKFVPNNAASFERLLKLVKEGDEKITPGTTAP